MTLVPRRVFFTLSATLHTLPQSRLAFTSERGQALRESFALLTLALKFQYEDTYSVRKYGALHEADLTLTAAWCSETAIGYFEFQQLTGYSSRYLHGGYG
jgi:hypothetical protein